jgi:hypothetical protein
MDTPPVNFVPVVDRASGDAQCPANLTGPDAGISAYYSSNNATSYGAYSASGNCPKRACLWPDLLTTTNHPSEANAQPGCNVNAASFTANFDQACDACATYEINNNVSDSYFGLRDYATKIALANAKFQNATCAETQIDCDKTLKATVTGPIRLIMWNTDYIGKCTTCSPDDPDYNTSSICSKQCTMSANSALSISLTSATGAAGQASVTFKTSMSCFLYLDRGWFQNVDSLRQWPNGYEGIRLPLKMQGSVRPITESFYFNLKQCCPGNGE